MHVFVEQVFVYTYFHTIGMLTLPPCSKLTYLILIIGLTCSRGQGQNVNSIHHWHSSLHCVICFSFQMWFSVLSFVNSVDVGPKMDLVGNLTTHAKAKGLKIGFYNCLYEWYNPLLTNVCSVVLSTYACWLIPSMYDDITGS